MSVFQHFDYASYLLGVAVTFVGVALGRYL